MASKKAPAKPAKTTDKKTPAKPAAAAAPATEKPAKPKAEPKPKIERAQANGITRPKDDSTTGKVWAIADAISKKTGQPAERSAVMAEAEKLGINEGTVATQFQRWRKFFGVKKQPKPAVEKAPKAPKTPKAPKAAASA